MRAHISIEKGHEYLRAKLKTQLDSFTLNDMFQILDKQSKGYLSVFDLEDVLIDLKRSKSSDLHNDVELLLFKYDKSGDRRITYLEFLDELTPRNTTTV